MLQHEKRIQEYEATLEGLKNSPETAALSQEEISTLEEKLQKLKKTVYDNLTPIDRVAISRHPSRPKAKDVIEHVCDSFKEVFGDRRYADDHAIIAGFGYISGKKVAIVAQEKGADTDARIYRNFGMPHPEGYRKALRIMQLAEKFGIPVVTLIDTPGAYAGLSAEERGQGWAIAENLFHMAKLKTPIISLVIGEGCSGGALGIGVSDRIAMLEHAYYSVISPEGCASILWKDVSQAGVAAKALQMQSEQLLEKGIVDTVIKEPEGGAHTNPQALYSDIRSYLSEVIDELATIPDLVDRRYKKYREIGAHRLSALD